MERRGIGRGNMLQGEETVTMVGDFKQLNMPVPGGVLRAFTVWPNAWPSMAVSQDLLLQRRVDFTRFFIVCVKFFGPVSKGAS